MKSLTIKSKITILYTVLLALVLIIALGGAFLASEHYSIDNMHEELEDELGDLEEDLKKYPDYFPGDDLLAYYDDGVMLSLYYTDGEMINGIIPDDFPMDHVFNADGIHELSRNEDHWFISDKKIVSPSGKVYWLRGIHSYSSIAMMVERLTKWVLILFPALIFITSFLGYRMISRYMEPVTEMSETVNEIINSNNLSLRLPSTDKKDELADLNDTFNHLLEHLENQFIREKQFVSDAAHELRTPVSVILSHCEYLLQDFSLEGEERQEAEIIYEKTQHLSNLVDALLMVSRMEKKSYRLNKDKVNLAVLAESVIDEMEEDAQKKNIRLKLTDHMKDPEFTGDMTLLVQLFSNLVSNSIKYGNENGNVSVLLREEKGLVLIQVEDDGIGIPKESLDKIWNRFYQVESSRSQDKGFGLGLFMVKRIVELHRGSIEVSSTLGKGTIFAVTLPKIME